MSKPSRFRNIIHAILVGFAFLAGIAIFALLLIPYSMFTMSSQADTNGETFPGGQPFEWVLASREQSESELVLKFKSDHVRPPFKRVDRVRISRPRYVSKKSEGKCTSRLDQVADLEFELTITLPLAELKGIEEVDVSFSNQCEALKYYGLSGNPIFSSGQWTTTVAVKDLP